MGGVANINDVLDGHVALEIECVDRLYLNAYLPNLQVGGQVVRFLCGHLGKPIASAALLSPIGNRFRAEVKRYAAERKVPILELARRDHGDWGDRKLDHVRPHLETGVPQLVGARGPVNPGFPLRYGASGSLTPKIV